MKIKSADIIYGVPFWTGLILQVFAIDLFRLTFIPTTVSVGLYLATGLVGFSLLRRKLEGTFKNKVLDIIVSLTWCVVSIGGIITFLLLATNYHLARLDTARKNFVIYKTGVLGKGGSSGCYQPYAVIEKDGVTKEIIFQCNLPKDIATYKSIDLTISKGALGFDVIKDKQLEEQTAGDSGLAATASSR